MLGAWKKEPRILPISPAKGKGERPAFGKRPSASEPSAGAPAYGKQACGRQAFGRQADVVGRPEIALVPSLPLGLLAASAARLPLGPLADDSSAGLNCGPAPCRPFPYHSHPMNSDLFASAAA